MKYEKPRKFLKFKKQISIFKKLSESEIIEETG